MVIVIGVMIMMVRTMMVMMRRMRMGMGGLTTLSGGAGVEACPDLRHFN